MIEFHLDTRSGVAPYLQIARQVQQALRMGTLQADDQLPTVREVVGKLAINPNTVLKAYRELDREGLVDARRGQGTFVSDDVAKSAPGDYDGLRSAFVQWVERARRAGLDEESINALVAATLQALF